MKNKCTQSLRKYSNSAVTAQGPTEKTSSSEPRSDVTEARDNPEPRKQSAGPCVVEPGCRQRQIYEDNGTSFRKLSATPILPSTGMPTAGSSSLLPLLPLYPSFVFLVFSLITRLSKGTSSFLRSLAAITRGSNLPVSLSPLSIYLSLRAVLSRYDYSCSANQDHRF